MTLRRPLPRLSLARAVVLAFLGGLGGTPQPDAFYLPPPQVPDATGVLLRAEPFERAVPEGAHAWRILYTTTRADEVHAIASALVVVPDTPEPVPVIAWTHGTTGVAVGCAPTLLPDPLASGAMPDPAAVIDAGWAIVATDYIGLGADPPHAYLIGEEAARATLDAIRAAHQLVESCSRTRWPCGATRKLAVPRSGREVLRSTTRLRSTSSVLPRWHLPRISPRW